MPIDRSRVKALASAPAPARPKPVPKPTPKPKPQPQAKAAAPKPPPAPAKKKKKFKPPKPLPEPPAQVRLRPRAMKAGAVDIMQSPWGSPFRIAEGPEVRTGPFTVVWKGDGPPIPDWQDETYPTRPEAQQRILTLFEIWLGWPGQAELLERGKAELRGKLLACTCNPKKATCHGTVWIRIANGNGVASGVKEG